MGNEIFSTAYDSGSYENAPLSPTVCTDQGRSYGDVITKFSRFDGLPIFLTHGASLAR